ncbi:MAG: ATP-dependent DNA helicase chl1 [Alectoria sarmentosa]|nr:MAG: ATP-dependent DNA helicase chl1 [Alectoria sarmentosa]
MMDRDDTGKSLSLICSSLTWLRDFQEDALQGEGTLEQENDEPNWVFEHAQAQRRNAEIQQKSELEARLRQVRAKELRQKQKYESGEPKAKRTKADEVRATSYAEDDARFELDEYNSDDEDPKAKDSSQPSKDLGLSSASLQLMEKLLGFVSKPSDNEDIMSTDDIKIYFCSRTHSQLAQFVQELRRVDFPEVSWAAKKDASTAGDTEDKAVVKHLPLGSRKNLCINSNVSRLGSAPAINERCLELQQPNTSKDHKCPFIPNKENETLVNDFRDHTLAKIRDIEDLGKLGKKIGICPYYASRVTIKPSEIVTLPYPLLLQKSAREALGISLKGHVIIIDEAHNLMDTISNIHSITVTQGQLKRCRSQLGVYLQNFRNRLKGKNRVYVAQMVRLIDSVSGCLEIRMTGKQYSEGIVDIGHLMAGKGVDQINLYKLMRYLQESKLARKVEGYTTHAQEQESKAKSEKKAEAHVSTMPVLTHVQSFLQTLTNPAAEGRFFCEKDEKDDLSLRYMLLDPTHHFKEIVEDARAIILAGGTMSPVIFPHLNLLFEYSLTIPQMDDYIRHLFAYVDPGRLKTFSCGHIIPKENLIALPVAKGPDGIDFDFTYDKRNSSAMIEALGGCLVQLSNIVPDGLVVFFPSYAYLEQVVHHWQMKSSGTVKPIWDRLLERKPIFREAKATTGIDDVLDQYSRAMANGHGGLLLSVIGGKMSEGINFSDALGRGVVVVGLPFPNIQSAQWKAKLEYIEQSTTTRTGSRNEGKAAARGFYENACMRAVNQSIGRAIRHKGDYASILLLDRRYRTARIEGKLPAWIRQGIVKGGSDGFGEVVESLRTFFKGKKKV